MLRIILGECDKALYGPSWFKFNYEQEWLGHPLVQRMLEDVDKSRYAGGLLIESDALGPIAPETLSGGVKTLISIYENPELIFDATSCGENCAKWLLEIGKEKDVTINLKYLMTFDEMDPFEIYLCNEDRVIRSNREYLYAAVHYV